MGLRVACIGECMIELSHADDTNLRLAYAGDTLNTAVYLARLDADLTVDYITVLGDDPYSDAMIDMWRAEGIGHANVGRLAGRSPGLYIIRVDEKGERRLFHYRSTAAARELFGEPTTRAALDHLGRYDLVYFSAITLSILSVDAIQLFAAGLDKARRSGTRVAIDTNYRVSGWPDRDHACTAISRFLGKADIALPTSDDERQLFGDSDIAATAARYKAAGVPEFAVKNGPEGCLLLREGGICHVPVPKILSPVDTTGAGDAFNAGYLAKRLAGGDVMESALAGHGLAAAVIGHRGAIIPRLFMPKA